MSPAPRVVHRGPGFDITGVVVGSLDNNVYVLRCTATGESVLFDAANDAELLEEMCRDLGVTRVLQTHGHHDHIGAAPALRRAGYPVGIGPGDAWMLEGHDFEIGDGEVIEVGRLRLRAIHTPGHTPGSTCFAMDGVLFSGDTLFPGGPGATRFPYSSFEQIIDSIENRLFALDDDTLVLPGHGAATTIGAERPQLGEWKARGW